MGRKAQKYCLRAPDIDPPGLLPTDTRVAWSNGWASALEAYNHILDGIMKEIPQDCRDKILSQGFVVDLDPTPEEDTPRIYTSGRRLSCGCPSRYRAWSEALQRNICTECGAGGRIEL